MNVRDNIKALLKKPAALIALLVSVMSVIILILKGKVTSLESILRLLETQAKDKELDSKIKSKDSELNAEKAREQNLKDGLSKKQEEAGKADPEDFWKKH